MTREGSCWQTRPHACWPWSPRPTRQRLLPVVAAVIDPGALHAWGMKAIRHLTRILPAIARKDPGLAIAVGTAPWQYEETRRTPTPMLGSAILELSGNLQQDVDGERYMVGTCFAELMQADPVAATTLLLAILQLPRMHQFPAADWRESPAVGQGAPLMFAGGHQVLTTMVDALARGMQDLAEAGGPAGQAAAQAPRSIRSSAASSANCTTARRGNGSLPARPPPRRQPLPEPCCLR